MGWIVYEEGSGRAMKYYKSKSVAQAQVTRHNNEIRDRPFWYRASPYSSNRDRVWLFCSYADYEGVLMGMKEPERRMWACCRGAKNG